MGYIYKVTNTLNGKVYIGQTRREVSIRWREHKMYAWTLKTRCCSALYSAIRKYGDDAFTVETIEECDSEHINEREMYWIKHYGSYGNGYNLTLGGDGGCKVEDADIRRLWDAGYCGIEIMTMLDICDETVYRRLKGMGITKQEIIKRGNERAAQKKTNPIYQYDADGNFVAEYASEKEAREKYGLALIHITPSKNAYLCAGYQWKRYKADKIDPVRYKRQFKEKKEKPQPKMIRPRKVVQLTLDGEYVQTHDSVPKAAKDFNVTKGVIYQACQGLIPTCKGYRWMYEKDYVPA